MKEEAAATEKPSIGRDEENEWMLGRTLLLDDTIPEDLVLLLHHLVSDLWVCLTSRVLDTVAICKNLWANS
jgi:hypothetical protein